MLTGLPSRAIRLDQIRFVVLDEADQMLNVGFEKDVETILNNVPQERQTMLFSGASRSLAAPPPSWAGARGLLCQVPPLSTSRRASACSCRILLAAATTLG